MRIEIIGDICLVLFRLPAETPASQSLIKSRRSVIKRPRGKPKLTWPRLTLELSIDLNNINKATEKAHSSQA